MRSFFVLALVLGVVGCSDTSPEAQIKSLIPEASSISNADFDKLAKSDSRDPDQIKSQSLSLILFALDPVSTAKTRPKASTDFQYLGSRVPKPSEVAEAMWKSKGRGYATMIQAKFIDSFDCRIIDTNAVGSVSFTATGLYSGKVEFTATRAANRWQIEEFRLPNYGIKTSRGTDGLWKKGTLDSKQSEAMGAEQDAQPDAAKAGE